jgi:Ribonuclease G/E
MIIAISVRAATARIALLNGDTLTEYAIWNPDNPDGVGDIHTARITTRAPAMAGSFADIGNETGFLPDSAGAAGLTEGAYLSVKIIRAAQSGKGPRLAATPEPPASKPGLIRRGPGPLLDLATRFPSAPIVIDDYAMMATLRPALEGRMTHKAVSFDAILEDEIATLAEPTAALPHGALMHIAVTPALTAIDIDAGAATADNAAKPPSQLALNTAIIPEIVRQIILRNLSGAILIDFAGMKSAARAKLTPHLAAALAQDPLKPRLLGFSNLGFAEISRPRIRPPLHETLSHFRRAAAPPSPRAS